MWSVMIWTLSPFSLADLCFDLCLRHHLLFIFSSPFTFLLVFRLGCAVQSSCYAFLWKLLFRNLSFLDVRVLLATSYSEFLRHLLDLLLDCFLFSFVRFSAFCGSLCWFLSAFTSVYLQISAFPHLSVTNKPRLSCSAVTMWA